MLSWLSGVLVTHTGRVVRDGGVCPEIGPIRTRFKLFASILPLSLGPSVAAISRIEFVQALLVLNVLPLAACADAAEAEDDSRVPW